MHIWNDRVPRLVQPVAQNKAQTSSNFIAQHVIPFGIGRVTRASCIPHFVGTCGCLAADFGLLEIKLLPCSSGAAPTTGRVTSRALAWLAHTACSTLAHYCRINTRRRIKADGSCMHKLHLKPRRFMSRGCAVATKYSLDPGLR